MPTRRRLDVELVRRHLATSREHAHELIADGAVVIDGFPADKPSRQVGESASIVVTDTDAEPGGRGQWVSRGAHKLLGALDAFEPRGLKIAGRVCLDAGASTGGFTQVLLARDATVVHAVDVGYGQLAWSLRNDPRVQVRERVNVRDLRAGDISPQPQVIVADLSFISLRLIVPVFAALATPDADMIIMVKPQFEVGREAIGAGGVVRDPRLRVDAVARVAEAAELVDWPAVAVTASVLPGPSGNVEYFLWLQHRAIDVSGKPVSIDRRDIEHAVQEGPQ